MSFYLTDCLPYSEIHRDVYKRQGKGRPNKFDIGPINTMISSNYIDGTRFRLSGMTTATLNPHWFLSGYGAYGLKDKRWQYSGTLTYSFNKRD